MKLKKLKIDVISNGIIYILEFDVLKPQHLKTARIHRFTKAIQRHVEGLLEMVCSQRKEEDVTVNGMKEDSAHKLLEESEGPTPVFSPSFSHPF